MRTLLPDAVRPNKVFSQAMPTHKISPRRRFRKTEHTVPPLPVPEAPEEVPAPPVVGLLAQLEGQARSFYTKLLPLAKPSLRPLIKSLADQASQNAKNMQALLRKTRKLQAPEPAVPEQAPPSLAPLVDSDVAVVVARSRAQTVNIARAVEGLLQKVHRVFIRNHPQTIDIRERSLFYQRGRSLLRLKQTETEPEKEPSRV